MGIDLKKVMADIGLTAGNMIAPCKKCTRMIHHGIQKQIKLHPVIYRINLVSVAATAGFTALLLLGITEILLIVRTSGYSPVVDSISALGLSPLGWLQSIIFLGVLVKPVERF